MSSDNRKPRQPWFAAHCEMQDAAAAIDVAVAIDAPAHAAIEIAKILTRFEDQIDDEWRALLMH